MAVESGIPVFNLSNTSLGGCYPIEKQILIPQCCPAASRVHPTEKMAAGQKIIFTFP